MHIYADRQYVSVNSHVCIFKTVVEKCHKLLSLEKYLCRQESQIKMSLEHKASASYS